MILFGDLLSKKIIGEDDSNLTNMFEKMLKPQTIVVECEFFLRNTVYLRPKPSDERFIEWSSWWAGTTARKPSIQSALSNACALHASIQEDTSPAYVRSLLESWWNDEGHSFLGVAQSGTDCALVPCHPEAWMLQAEGPYSTGPGGMQQYFCTIPKNCFRLHGSTRPEWPDIFTQS